MQLFPEEHGKILGRLEEGRGKWRAGGTNSEGGIYTQLTVHAVSFQDFQRMSSQSTNVTDGQMNGRTDRQQGRIARNLFWGYKIFWGGIKLNTHVQ